jgi:hypothetical protein
MCTFTQFGHKGTTKIAHMQIFFDFLLKTGQIRRFKGVKEEKTPGKCAERQF